MQRNMMAIKAPAVTKATSCVHCSSSSSRTVHRGICNIPRPRQRSSILSAANRPRAVGVSLGVNVMACTDPRAHIHGFPAASTEHSSLNQRETRQSLSYPKVSSDRIFPPFVPDPTELRNIPSAAERAEYTRQCATTHSNISSMGAIAERSEQAGSAGQSQRSIFEDESVFDFGTTTANKTRETSAENLSRLKESSSLGEVDPESRTTSTSSPTTTPGLLARVSAATKTALNQQSLLVEQISEKASEAWDKVNPTGPVLNEREFFSKLTAVLMEGEVWTFARFLEYQLKMRELLPKLQTFLERKKQEGFFGELPPREQMMELRQCDMVIRVLRAMTPRELQSNCRLVFCAEAKRLLAEKAGCKAHDVNLILDQHNELRGDRRWFQIRQQFGRRLPYDFQERSRMALYDRPRTKVDPITEQLLTKVGVRDARKNQPSHPKRAKTWVYRRPSVGGNRWATQPPRWMPRNPPNVANRKVRLV
ncbi:unnamed protein product [Amoebophrya sp. A120]|nr:unnamed protein product [Amoebophrya sp. A120]|eukprot:GSA120T00010831001.1